jgi:hypothetical protein
MISSVIPMIENESMTGYAEPYADAFKQRDSACDKISSVQKIPARNATPKGKERI